MLALKTYLKLEISSKKQQLMNKVINVINAINALNTAPSLEQVLASLSKLAK